MGCGGCGARPVSWARRPRWSASRRRCCRTQAPSGQSSLGEKEAVGKGRRGGRPSPCVCRRGDIWTIYPPMSFSKCPSLLLICPPPSSLPCPAPRLEIWPPTSSPLTDCIQCIHALEQGIMVGAGSLGKWGGGGWREVTSRGGLRGAAPHVHLYDSRLASAHQHTMEISLSPSPA